MNERTKTRRRKQRINEELREANKKFKEFLNKIRKRKNFNDEIIETFFYVFYLEGFKDGRMFYLEGFKDGRNR